MLLIFCGVITLAVLIFLGVMIAKSGKKLEEEGITTVGVITGGHLEDNLYRYEVKFTDKTGKETWGYSQGYSGNGVSYETGDQVTIKYLIEKTMGFETVEVIIQDETVK